MGDGTLPPETFKFYMIQDYLYLVCRLVTPPWLMLIALDSICSSECARRLQSEDAGGHRRGALPPSCNALNATDLD